MSEEAAVEAVAEVEATAIPARDFERERDDFFLYVEKEVRPYAAELGLVVAVTRAPVPADEDFKGPTMRYDPATGESRVFKSKADVPAGWVSGDEFFARNAG